MLCGVKNEVVTECFLWNPNKWAIYRENGDEITYEIQKGMIINASKKLTKIEIDYIIKYVFKRVKNPPLKDIIINYGMRGYPDQEISDILSIHIHQVQPILTRYWRDKMINQKKAII